MDHCLASAGPRGRWVFACNQTNGDPRSAMVMTALLDLPTAAVSEQVLSPTLPVEPAAPR